MDRKGKVFGQVVNFTFCTNDSQFVHFLTLIVNKIDVFIFYVNLRITSVSVVATDRESRRDAKHNFTLIFGNYIQVGTSNVFWPTNLY